MLRRGGKTCRNTGKIPGFFPPFPTSDAVRTRTHGGTRDIGLGGICLILTSDSCLLAARCSFHVALHARRHLINSRRWRGQRFGLATRREEGASPQWGCDRRTTTWPAQRSAAPLFFSRLLSFILSRFSSFTPPRLFMRWLH